MLRVLLAGLCRTDCYVAEGHLGPRGGGRILGHEIAAEVVACGSAVAVEVLGSQVSVDPRIRCGECAGCVETDPCTTGMRGMTGTTTCLQPRFLGVDLDGGFAEFVRVPVSSLVRVALGIDLRAVAYVEPIAATLAILGAGIRPEERGLVVGQGRIAALAAEILVIHGFESVVHVDPTKSPQLAPGAFDFAVENGVDAKGMASIIGALRRGGRIVIKSRRLDPLMIDPIEFVPKELELVAAYYGSFVEAASLVASEKIDLQPLWSEPRALEEFAAVFAQARWGEGQKLFFAVAKDRAMEFCACAGSSAPLL
ncbi:MAG TPA: L-threonine 3-dehydrogenase [Nannocystis exedens]|nr:L-threonine 3-dehydrogenase [Nannocystis exedens]